MLAADDFQGAVAGWYIDANLRESRLRLEPLNAAGEVRRSSLHKEVVGAEKMSNREFHDAILKMNAIPVEMVRTSLTKQALDARFAPGWKFCGSP